MACDIFSVGWDWSRLGQSICIIDDESKYIESFNINATAHTIGLAKATSNSIVAGTLTNSHTVQMLRCIFVGKQGYDQAMCVDGKYNIALIESTRPFMAEAARTGWKWMVLHADVKKFYGDKLLEMLSTSMNVNVARREHEMEVLTKLVRIVQSSEDIDKIDWLEIPFRTSMIANYLTNI